MAPFRASRSTRSNRAGLTAEADIFDGLPIRQWRMQESVFGAPIPVDSLEGVDLPETVLAGEGYPGVVVQGHDISGANDYPMPKGSNLYAPWCQQLLRSTRSGRIVKRPEGSWGSGGAVAAPNGRHTSEDQENNGQDGEEAPANSGPSESKIDNSKGFPMSRWTPIPRHQEEQEVDYLAKRRKGLARMNIAIDAIGINGYNQSQIVSVDPLPEEMARKRNPPPRRKPKRGPGRGKKKITDTPGGGVSASAEELARLEGEDNAAGGNDGNDSQDLRTDGVDDDDDDDDMEEDDGEEGDEGEDEPHVARDEKTDIGNDEGEELANGVENSMPEPVIPAAEHKDPSPPPVADTIVKSPPANHISPTRETPREDATAQILADPVVSLIKAEEVRPVQVPAAEVVQDVDNQARESANDTPMDLED